MLSHLSICLKWSSIFVRYFSLHVLRLNIEYVTLECFSFLYQCVREKRKEDGKQTPIMSHVLSINSRHSRLKSADTRRLIEQETSNGGCFFPVLFGRAPFWRLSGNWHFCNYRLLLEPRTHAQKNWSDKNCLIDWKNCACGSVRPSITRRRAAEQTTVWFCLISASHLFRSFFFSFICSFRCLCAKPKKNIDEKCAKTKRLDGFVSTLYVIAIVYLANSVIGSCAVAAKKQKRQPNNIPYYTLNVRAFQYYYFLNKKKRNRERMKEKQIVEWRTRLGEHWTN